MTASAILLLAIQALYTRSPRLTNERLMPFEDLLSFLIYLLTSETIFSYKVDSFLFRGTSAGIKLP